jgi:dihydrofolate synthase/folylpolyglutamate synthase
VTVDFDHVIPLGPTIEKIAGHKAGIIKPAIPCVTAVAPGPARAVIEREAQALGAPLYRLGDEVVCTVRQVAQDGSVFDYASPWQSLAGVHVGLLGAHQVINAGIALSVAHLLRQSGYDISEDAMREGLRSARLPGRLEIVQRQPTVLLDGAHNPEKMRSLTAALNQIFPGQRLILVIGVLAAKQAEEIVAEVVPLASTVVVTSPHVLGKPAVEPAELAAICRRLSGDVVVEPDVPVAVDRARDLAGRDGLVCVTGSLYMVGQARELWVPTPMILDQCTSFPTRPDGSPRPVRSGSGRRSAYSDRPAGCAG